MTIRDRDQVSDFGSPAMSRYTTRYIPKDNSIAIVGDCRERRRSGYCRILPEIWEVVVRKSPVIKGWDNRVSICNPPRQHLISKGIGNTHKTLDGRR